MRAGHPTASVRHNAPSRDLLLGRVLCRGLLDHRRDNGIVGRNPIRRDIPFFTVPGLDAARSPALVIGAGHLNRLQLVLEAELLQPFRGQIEIFKALPDLLAGQCLLAVGLYEPSIATAGTDARSGYRRPSRTFLCGFRNRTPSPPPIILNENNASSFQSLPKRGPR